MHAGRVEDLVGVDVADAGDHVLVEEQRLHPHVARARSVRGGRRPSVRRRAGRRRGAPPRAARCRRGRGRTRRPRRTSADRRTTAPGRRGPATGRGRATSRRACAVAVPDPAPASSSCPLMRRWIITVSPVSSGLSRYFPRRPASVIVAPVRPSMTARRDVRRTVRSRPTSTWSIRRPTTNRSSPRRTVSTSGNSGIGIAQGVAFGGSSICFADARAWAATAAAACSAVRFDRPCPVPSTVPSTITLAKNRLSWSGPSSVRS